MAEIRLSRAANERKRTNHPSDMTCIQRADMISDAKTHAHAVTLAKKIQQQLVRIFNTVGQFSLVVMHFPSSSTLPRASRNQSINIKGVTVSEIG